MLPMRTVAMLVWTLAVTGLGYALVNNAIFYRAVLMTDWLFAYFILLRASLFPQLLIKRAFDCCGAVDLIKIIQENERSGKGARSKDGELGATRS